VDLVTCKVRAVTGCGDGMRALQLRGAEVAGTHMAHLALANQIVERAQGLRQRHERIAVVQL